jgi:hypothetical protein
VGVPLAAAPSSIFFVFLTLALLARALVFLRPSLVQVKRKAQTIMKTADKDGNGELSIEEFRIVAQKSPNVLFPAFNKPGQE